MMKNEQQRESNLLKYEYALYITLGVAVLLFPILRIGGDALDQGAFPWEYILSAWIGVLPFFLLILIHSTLLMPYLFFKRRFTKYILATLLLLALFAGYTSTYHNYRRERLTPYPYQRATSQNDIPGHPFLDPQGFRQQKGYRSPSGHRIPGPVIMDTLIALLMLGCNLSIRLIVKNYEGRRRMEQLERAQIEHELSQLRAQVSPHFLMNCLNNIHGMVERDARRAQEMILELSEMMRYILYESSPQQISLAKELEFLRSYIALMSVRYSKRRVKINFNAPTQEQAGGILVPPLIFIIFIENAFKHGISYQGDSFVDILFEAEPHELRFRCTNSLPQHGQQELHPKGGIGLKNIRKRLDILYGEHYNLTIDRQETSFHVSLKLKSQDENQMYCGG